MIIIPQMEDLNFHVIWVTCCKEVMTCSLQLLRMTMLFAWQRNNFEKAKR